MNIRVATWDEFAALPCHTSGATRRDVSDRDARILALHRNGLRGTEIARLVDVSRERVRQIVKRETGESVRKPARTIACPICDQPIVRNDPLHTSDPAHVAARRGRQVDRFWANAGRRLPGECWEWTGARYPTGYGHTSGRFVKGGGGYAHRVAYIVTNGTIAPGLQVDHLCRSRACVNPAHLEAVTPRENIMRSPTHPCAINARKTHCKQGHAFSADNTLRDAHGSRRCRACSASSQRRYLAARRARREIAA